jgi:hypothetical protein
VIAQKIAGVRRSHPPDTDRPGLWEIYRTQRNRRGTLEQAKKAIRARANGQDRTAVEQIIDEEYVARGLTRPTGVAREMLIEQVLRPLSTVEQARVGIDMLTALGVGAVRAVRWLSAHSVPAPDAESDDDSNDLAKTGDGDSGGAAEILFRIPSGKQSVLVDSGPEEQRACFMIRVRGAA